MSEATAVATTEKKTLSTAITELMTSQQARAYIEPFLPKGTDIQRVAASLVLAMKKDDSGKLRKCTPESLILGVAKIQQWGLELGESAFLLPFKNEAVPVRGYIALAELSAACGYPLEVKVVRAGDHFEYRYGLQPLLDHRPKAQNTGAITHAWCIIHRPRNQQPFFEVMTIDEIDAIRHTYSKQWKDGACPAWYAKKTIVRQTAKLLPKTPELARLHAVIQEEPEIDEVLSVEELPVVDAAIQPATDRENGGADGGDDDVSWFPE